MMDQDLNTIKKILLISLLVLFIIGIVSFFLSSLQIFLAILISELITFIFFAGTLFSYLKVYRSSAPNKLKYILYIYIAKLAVAGLAFFLIARFGYVNMIGFIFSFLILFTIFLNLEIFLIYKKILFSKN
jgi:hypothetical protein